MDSQEWIRWVGNVLLFWSALAGVASVVVHSRVPWWRTVMGRHLMGYLVTMTVVLVLSCIQVVLGHPWWLSLLGLIAFAGVCIFMSQRLWLQVKAQLDSARDDSVR